MKPRSFSCHSPPSLHTEGRAGTHSLQHQLYPCFSASFKQLLLPSTPPSRNPPKCRKTRPLQWEAQLMPEGTELSGQCCWGQLFPLSWGQS